MIDDNNNHDWMAVKRMMRNPKKLAEQIANFDYDGASSQQVELILNMQLENPEVLMQKSAACGQIATMLCGIQDYYKLKKQTAMQAMTGG